MGLQHGPCPNCGSEKVDRTCMGYIGGDPPPEFDINIIRCEGCGLRARIKDLHALITQAPEFKNPEQGEESNA